LTIGVVHDKVSERYNFFEIDNSFQALSSDIPIEFIGLSLEKYKHQVKEWLTTGTGPGVLFWYCGVRFKQFIRQGYIENLDGLSAKHNWQKSFSPETLKTASFNRSIYAIPVSYYQWGIYYNKSLLKQFNISPPGNWKDFLDVYKVIKSSRLEPTALGSSEPWVLGAWFDYFNLRLNGLDFHQNLLGGAIPFTDQRVIKVFEYWAELVNKNYFLAGHQRLDRNEAMLFVFRDLSAFNLNGNSLSNRIPGNVEQNIGFMPFPEIVPEHDGNEGAPMDVFFIRASSKNKEDAKTFIHYMPQAEVQAKYNKYAGGYPPNKASSTSDNLFSKDGLHLLQKAKSLAQFFDRDSESDFSEPALTVFGEFMQNPNIKETVQKLEQLRQTKLLDNHP
jgi:multiple sugar transport system substrate-binding protein